MYRHILVLAAACLVSARTMDAQQKIEYPATPSDLSLYVARIVQQGFSMKLWMNNRLTLGVEAAGPQQQLPPGDCPYGVGLEYSPGSCVEHLFAAGPVIGARINGVSRVSRGYNINTAQSDFSYAKRDSTRYQFWVTSIHSLYEPNKKGVDDDGDGKIDEDELDGLDNDGDWNRLNDDIGSDGVPDSLEVGCLGSYDPVSNPDPAFDDYDPPHRDFCHLDPVTGIGNLKDDKNKYTEKNGLPDHGEPHVDEDYAAVSDNDVASGITDTVTAYGPPGRRPMGVKVWQKSYAWNRGLPIDAAIIMEYTFINIGNNILDDVFLAMMEDIDIEIVNTTDQTGGLAAYDPATFTAYKYAESGSGLTPLGISLIATTKPLDSLHYIFQWFPGGEFPLQDSIQYAWLSGSFFNGQRIKNDQAIPFPYSHILFSFGPFEKLKPGDSVKAIFAFVSGESRDDMLNNTRLIKAFYNNGFQIGYLDNHQSLPAKYAVLQNYPNPFNGQTTIHYELPVSADIKLTVYNVLGEQVELLVNGVEEAGYKSVGWNAARFPSGVYFYELRIDGHKSVRKMLLIR